MQTRIFLLTRLIHLLVCLFFYEVFASKNTRHGFFSSSLVLIVLHVAVTHHKSLCVCFFSPFSLKLCLRWQFHWFSLSSVLMQCLIFRRTTSFLKFPAALLLVTKMKYTKVSVGSVAPRETVRNVYAFIWCQLVYRCEFVLSFNGLQSSRFLRTISILSWSQISWRLNANKTNNIKKKQKKKTTYTVFRLWNAYSDKKYMEIVLKPANAMGKRPNYTFCSVDVAHKFVAII